ncbi:hypothetical protein GIY62_14710 [Burkholderia plantarii]|uniref:hypothetical protein n=1 Tax=Burkholderia plantarii TaxID=41899 RepID=UPI00272D2685|nr:hypothetical protein [Burkholderia plantarii]WLE58378.1 hypothetical protein GIY62_14710 [Burkholderia plantarii]
MAANRPRANMDVMFHLKNAQESFFDTERRRAVDQYFRSEDDRLGRSGPSNRADRREQQKAMARQAAEERQAAQRRAKKAKQRGGRKAR